MNKTKFWSIARDASNQYIVALYNGGIKVFDLDGNAKTVTIASGSSYLTSTNPREDFKLVNIVMMRQLMQNLEILIKLQTYF